jgi:predicted deacylase
VDGTELGIPVLLVCGKADGPVLLIDGGIHGDEHEGAYAISALVKELDPNRLRGVVIAVPVINVAAFQAMQRGNPRDNHSHDLNRFYPGRANGYLTERIAHVHNSIIGSVADVEIAIHSGGNICYLAESIFTPTGDEKSLELAKAMGPGWEIVLDAPRSVGSPMAAMADRGKPSITVELGGSAATMPGDLLKNVEILKKALINVCRHYDMLEGEAEYARGYWRGKQRVVQASASGILEPNPDLPLKQSMNRGDLLMRINDLFGNPLEDLRAPCDGTLFGFRTYPSVFAGDWVLFCGDATFKPAEAS